MELAKNLLDDLTWFVHKVADLRGFWTQPEGFDYWHSYGDDLDINFHNWEGNGLECAVYAVKDGNIITQEWVVIPMKKGNK